MEKKRTEKQRVNKIVIGGLREAIRAHGPITKLLIGSAAKRITGTLIAKKETEDNEGTDTTRS